MTYDEDPRLTDVLRIYADDPLEDGDAVLFVDDHVCLEIAGLADHWDEQMRSSLGSVLDSAASRVVVAIARRGADLTAADYALWRDLHDELRDRDVSLLPVKALPAA